MKIAKGNLNNPNLKEAHMNKLEKKMRKLEKEYEKNPLATIRRSKLLKRATKLQAKIDEVNERPIYA